MKNPYSSNRSLLLAAAAICSAAFTANAFTFSLQEQGALTGFVNGGGGTVSITPLGTDHWQVTVQDSRIGTPISAGMSLAYTEPELRGGRTAYNNILVLSVVPGTATFDVLSDEVAPYATILPDSTVFPIQATSVDTINLNFTDVADTVPEPGTGTLVLAGGACLLLRRRGASRR